MYGLREMEEKMMITVIVMDTLIVFIQFPLVVLLRMDKFLGILKHARLQSLQLLAVVLMRNDRS